MIVATTIVCEKPYNHKSMIKMASKNCLQALIQPKMKLHQVVVVLQ